MPNPVLTQYPGLLGAYIRANRGGGKTSEQGNNLSGIQRVGILRSNAGDTFYLYYDPAANVIAFDTTAPTDAGVTG